MEAGGESFSKVRFHSFSEVEKEGQHRTLQGTEPKARQLGQRLLKKHSLSSEWGTWKHLSRESSEVCGPVTAKCLPFLPLEWQDYSQYSDCVSLRCLGVWGQTTCLSISNAKGSRSREAISVPDGDYRILVCKADSMIRCDLWGSGERARMYLHVREKWMVVE